MIILTNTQERLYTERQIMDAVETALGSDVREYLEQQDETAVIKAESEQLKKACEQEICSMEGTLEAYQQCLQDVYETAEQLRSELETAKRINRDKIIDVLSGLIKEVYNIT
jgi:hypothetical protein